LIILIVFILIVFIGFRRVGKWKNNLVLWLDFLYLDLF
jgi:hypothetical protein